MKQNDIEFAQRAVASLGKSKHLRRYPAALDAQLAALVRGHPERSLASLARELDIAPQTLKRIVTRAAAPLVPVRVVARSSRASSALVVRGPCGLVVEGLDMGGVAELIRALS